VVSCRGHLLLVGPRPSVFDELIVGRTREKKRRTSSVVVPCLDGGENVQLIRHDALLYDC